MIKGRKKPEKIFFDLQLISFFFFIIILFLFSFFSLGKCTACEWVAGNAKKESPCTACRTRDFFWPDQLRCTSRCNVPRVKDTSSNIKFCLPAQ